MIESRSMSSLLHTALLCALFLVGPAHAQDADEVMLGLRDGRVLWGTVEEHDEGGLRFRRLDTGGTARLDWSRLDPRFEEELRQRYGYVDRIAEEVMISADRLRTVEGKEVVGLIVHRSEDALHVKTAQGTLAIPKRRIAGPAVRVSAPALDLYTREELYQKELVERRSQLEQEGVEGAKAHYEFAQFCERILDYGSAVVHYELSGERAAEWRPSDLAGALARAQRKAEAQAELDALREIRRLRQQRKYEEALALVAAFRTQYAGSPLLEELAGLRASIERARDADLSEAVVRRWHHWAERLTKEAGRELGYAAALEWVDSELPAAVLARVTGDLERIEPGIDPSRVRALWDARGRTRNRHASYGIGTWLLGDGRARVGLDQEVAETRAGRGDAAREELEDRIRRFLDRQRTVERASGGRASADPARFWVDFGSTGRAHWLLAYYAEFSGDFHVAHVGFRACRDCGGTGVREIGYLGPSVSGATGPRTRLVSCPTCHHVGIVRRISYR